MDKRFENFSVNIIKMSKLVQKIKQLEVGGYKLQAIHVMCVYYLNEHREGLTASELARYTLEDKAAISRALIKLKENGYANYDPKKYNAAVKLTPEGEKLAQILLERASNAVNFVGRDLTETEREEFYRVIATLSDNLNTYYEDLKKSRKK